MYHPVACVIDRALASEPHPEEALATNVSGNGWQVKAEEDKKRVLALKADGSQAAAGTPKPPRAPSAYVVRTALRCQLLFGFNPLSKCMRVC